MVAKKDKGQAPAVDKNDFVLDVGDVFADADIPTETVEKISEMEEATGKPAALKRIVEFYKTYGMSAKELIAAHRKLVEVVKGVTKRLAANLEGVNGRVDSLETGYGEKGDLSIRDYLAELDKGISSNEKVLKELAGYLREEAAERKADIDHIYGLLDGLAKNAQLTAKIWDEKLPNGWIEYKGRRKAKL